MAEKISDKRKRSFYFPKSMIDEIEKEALRQDRSLSYIMQTAWKEAREIVMKYPTHPLCDE